ncbi:hypothetical protein QE438_003000 [Pseudoxanthomonas sp. SORGH_AS 997]|nr:hypothetical protein [Pseudoxanthomonas sp. SORGH_AS_0997]
MRYPAKPAATAEADSTYSRITIQPSAQAQPSPRVT